MRRLAIAAAGGVAVAAAWTTIVEPRRLRVRRVDVEVEDWPGALDDLKIALVADLHAGAPHMDEKRVGQVVAAVNHARPDIIALLGDYVDPDVRFGGRVEPETVAEQLAELDAPLGSFAVLGNHDWTNDGDRVRHALREQLIDVLENDAASVQLAGEVLWIVGLSDLRERTPDLSTLGLVPASAPLLVLTHDPDLFPQLPSRPLLALAGHTHGGQVNVPIVRDIATPSRYGDRYGGGLVREGERVMYVSRGIGTAGFPVRLRATPEIVMLRVRVAGSVR
jgi:predicted MPP superfamily phosphohydrolase